MCKKLFRLKAFHFFFIAATLVISFAQADMLGQINIRLSGNVVELGCVIDPGDVNKFVSLGEWSTRDLKNKGNTTGPVAFSIHLTQCATDGVTTAFTGTPDNVDNSLLIINSDEGSAGGIAVQIMDNNHTRIPMGSDAPRGKVDSQGNATLNFFANYMATGNKVTPGSANAETEFMLRYD